jgi:hypothetical protein
MFSVLGIYNFAVSFKKDAIFGAAQTKLGPSYFVRALVIRQKIKSSAVSK